MLDDGEIRIRGRVRVFFRALRNAINSMRKKRKTPEHDTPLRESRRRHAAQDFRFRIYEENSILKPRKRNISAVMQLSGLLDAINSREDTHNASTARILSFKEQEIFIELL